MPDLSQQHALGVGVAGALVDVSTYVDAEAGIEFGWGTQSEFDPTDGGEFSFVLDNFDGRFTPDNASSPLVTKMSEGVAVSWLLGTRLVAGKVTAIEPMFPGDDAAWSQVKVTAGDQLDEASRTGLQNFVSSQVLASNPYAYWPLASDLLDYSGRGAAALRPTAIPIPQIAFVSAPVFIGDGQAELGGPTGLTTALSGSVPVTADRPTPGWVGVYVTPLTQTGTCQIQVGNPGRFQIIDGALYIDVGGVATFVQNVNAGTTYYFSLYVAGNTAGSVVNFYIDDVLVHTNTAGGYSCAGILLAIIGSASADSLFRVAQLSHTATRVYGAASKQTTEAARLTGLAATVTTLTLDTLPGLLSPQPLGIADTEGQSALDAINDVMTAEQGYLYTKTTGTLLAPVQVTKVRERTRPVTVSYSFDVERELDGAPELVRDLTNMVSAVTVSGPSVEARVVTQDASIISRVGTKNASESVPFAQAGDLTLWGQDRILRGANIRLRVSVADVDAKTTPTDRSSDLLAMLPGDRIRFTNLPSTQLGFTTWDGWLIGGEESHTLEENLFTFYFAPAMNPTATFNVSEFMGGTSLTLSAGINSAVTTMSVATTDARITTTSTDWPFTVVVDSEQMSVTNVTGATPQVLTIVRGVNGTTAAAHSSGAVVELANIPGTTDPLVFTNKHTNPSLEVDGTGYSVASSGTGNTFTATVETTGGHTGPNFYRVTASGTNSGQGNLRTGAAFPVTAGATISFSYWYRCSGIAVPIEASARTWSNADGTGTEGLAGSTSYTPVQNVWTRITFTYTVPGSGVLSLQPSIRFPIGSTLAGRTFDIDDQCIVDGATPLDFNGDTAASPPYTYGWNGVTGASSSARVSGGQSQESIFAF